MKLKSGFIVHETGEETILVPLGSVGWSGVVRGNKTLGIILELLKKDTTEGAIIDTMKERFAVEDTAIIEDVECVLRELRRIGAVDE